MAIKVTANKGGYGLLAAYLMVAECTMQKSVIKDVASPPPDAPEGEEDPNVNWVPHTVYYPETLYKAIIHVYSDDSDRVDNYGRPLINFFITFDHAPDGDMVEEAYRYIKDHGIPDWNVTAMVDV